MCGERTITQGFGLEEISSLKRNKLTSITNSSLFFVILVFINFISINSNIIIIISMWDCFTSTLALQYLLI